LERIARGEIWWLGLPGLGGSAPAGTRPVLVVQANAYNRSSIQTVIVVAITSNELLADAPGNVLIHPKESGLRHISVVNVSQVATVDKDLLRDKVATLTNETLAAVDHGLRRVLQL
jgi:mRNA interferase MazF